jgi:polysaccharide biosynthesis protein PslH
MSKVLFISAHAPTTQYPQAGQKIAFMNLAKYAALHEFVDVIVIANTTEIVVAKDLQTDFGNSLYTYPLTKFKKAINCLNYYQAPLKFASRFNRAVSKKIQELLIAKTYDVIHFEYSHAAVYLDIVKKYIDSKQTKIVISIHDVLTQVWLRQSVKSSFFDLEVARIFRYEQKLYSNASELWVLSKKDRDLLSSLFSIGSEKLIVKPPKASSFVYQVKRRAEKIEKKSLLFWAAMERPENEQAILNFVDKCFKKLLQQDRNFKQVLALAGKQITVTGFVEDPTIFFEKAEIGIVPLLKGGGVKLKTLEMLEAGLPVVATSIGAEGVVSPDKKLIVSDSFENWFELLTKESQNSVVAGVV